jgi:hypothetical protein
MRRQITLFALVAVLCGGLRGADPVLFRSQRTANGAELAVRGAMEEGIRSGAGTD